MVAVDDDIGCSFASFSRYNWLLQAGKVGLRTETSNIDHHSIIAQHTDVNCAFFRALLGITVCHDTIVGGIGGAELSNRIATQPVNVSSYNHRQKSACVEAEKNSHVDLDTEDHACWRAAVVWRKTIEDVFRYLGSDRKNLSTIRKMT